MKKGLIKLMLILSFSFLPFFNAYAYSEDYEIDNYKVEINVNENHSLNVVETIDANFFVEKHGIKRTLPMHNTYSRKINDEKVEIESDTKISDYSVNEKYTVEKGLGDFTFKIGDANKTITGKKQYIIKYTYDMGEDYIKDFDDLYYNIIGTQWDCRIKNVEFYIQMPKDFDQTKINFTIGRYGATYNKDINYSIENNLIKGNIKQVDGYALSSYEGLTVRIELPEGYYQNEQEYTWYNNPDDSNENYEKVTINATLKENNTMHVDETYFVKYKKYITGIERNIKTKGFIYRKVGSKKKKQKINYIIDNIKTNTGYFKYMNDDKLSITVNDGSDTDVNKIYEYKISYDVDFGDDFTDIDDLFIYKFEDEHVPIKEFNLKLNLPKEVNAYDIDILNDTYNLGYSDSTFKYKQLLSSYDKKSINVSFKKDYFGYALNSMDDVSIRIKLPEGYFVNERKNINPYFNAQATRTIIIVTLLIISSIIYLLFGYKKKNPVIAYYNAPDNMTPAEVGYIYKGKVLKKHIISLIIYLANKGYITIVSKKRNDFELIKEKELEFEENYVKTTYNGLFKYNRTKTRKSDLVNSFYTSLESAMNQLRKKHKIYNMSHYVSIAVYMVIIVALFIIYNIENSLINNYVIDSNIMKLSKINKYSIIVIIIINILFILFSKKMREDVREKYDKIIGFKDYLLKVEKEKLELLVEENPNYFYDILPYAYVLGISKKWSKKFEGIDIKPAEWYDSNLNVNSVFKATTFVNSFSHTLTTVSAVSSSRPYESSGGGYSGGGSFSGGGGSSGGGGGGGGGSSW